MGLSRPLAGETDDPGELIRLARICLRSSSSERPWGIEACTWGTLSRRSYGTDQGSSPDGADIAALVDRRAFATSNEFLGSSNEPVAMGFSTNKEIPGNLFKSWSSTSLGWCNLGTWVDFR